MHQKNTRHTKLSASENIENILMCAHTFYNFQYIFVLNF